jgi:hypothetical protein
MKRPAVTLLEPEINPTVGQPPALRRLHVEVDDAESLAEVSARLGVLHPELRQEAGPSYFDVAVPAADADELSQTISDLILKVRLNKRDAGLRELLYARLLK